MTERMALLALGAIGYHFIAMLLLLVLVAEVDPVAEQVGPRRTRI